MFLLDYIFHALGLRFQELIMYKVYQSGWAELYGGQKYPECQWLKTMKVVLSFHATWLFWVGGGSSLLACHLGDGVGPWRDRCYSRRKYDIYHKASTQEWYMPLSITSHWGKQAMWPWLIPRKRKYNPEREMRISMTKPACMFSRFCHVRLLVTRPYGL